MASFVESVAIDLRVTIIQTRVTNLGRLQNYIRILFFRGHLVVSTGSILVEVVSMKQEIHFLKVIILFLLFIFLEAVKKTSAK